MLGRAPRGVKQAASTCPRGRLRRDAAVGARLGPGIASGCQDPTHFEAEWRRVGQLLRSDLGVPAANALDGVAPAAARAIGEAARPQVRVYYEASLDYGQNTQPDAGLYYIGAALAQRELDALGLRYGERGRAPRPGTTCSRWCSHRRWHAPSET